MWETNPELLFTKTVPSGSAVVHMRSDIPPFSDIRVRRAAMMAVNQPEMNEDYYLGTAYPNTWPVQPAFPELFTPIEEMNEEDQMLYGYYPDEAEALLDEAGYPRGPDGVRFSTTLTTLPYPAYTEPSLMVKEYLDAIGIDVTLEVPEQATAISILYGRQFEHMFMLASWGNDRPTDSADCTAGGWLTSPYNFSNVVDDVCYETMQQYYQTADPVERAALLKAQYGRQISLVWEIGLPTPGGFFFWGPWIKGYNGEICLGNAIGFGVGTLIAYPWIDQDLKYQITGRR
jgi:ABC-type transport system substrate-binding protein